MHTDPPDVIATPTSELSWSELRPVKGSSVGVVEPTASLYESLSESVIHRISGR